MTNNTKLLEKVKFDSISDALHYSAQTEKKVSFFSPDGELISETPYRQLQELSIEIAKRLNTLGFKRYARIGLIADTDLQFLIFFYACQHAGLVPCPLPYVSYAGGEQAYIDRLALMSKNANLSTIIGPEDIRFCLVQAAKTCKIHAYSFGELTEERKSGDIAPLGKDDPAYIQYSSGSTSDPKGIWLTQHAVTSNIAMILEYGSQSLPSDHTFSWLPFFHDMGFAGLVLTPMFGISGVDFISPSTFARNPSLWVKLMSERRSTVTYAPSFAYALAAKIQNAYPQSYDLSSLRLAGIGGDMIRLSELQAFAKAFSDCSFREESFLPSYGMSESVLGIAFHPSGEKIFTHNLEPKSLPLVSCGYAPPGINLKIVDQNEKEVPEQTVGHILVHAPDLMTSYLNDEETTQAAMRTDGYRDTGDMGYLINGRLVITGRAKELILWRGRNIWPQDIEQILEQADTLVQKAVAFSVEENDEEKIIAFVQTDEKDASKQEILTQTLATALFSYLGIPAKIIFVSPNEIPYTQTGKLSRIHARNSYLKNYTPTDHL